MEIIKHSLGQLQANCYFLIKGNQCLVIDPAGEASFILEQIQRRKLQLVAMLATHGHFDHILAAGEIQRSFNIPLYVFKEDMFLIKRLNETAKYFLGYNPFTLPPNNIIFLQEGKLEIRSWQLEILHTAGHTPGSCCFYFEKDKIVFTGDTLFKQGVGRYDFSYSNKNDLRGSLKKLLSLPKETIVYPGHGEKTILTKETSPFHYINIMK